MAVAAVARQGAEEADKTRIRARIEHVGSEYRREVTSGTCELCIAEWTARIRDIAVDARRLAAAHDEAPTSCRRGRGAGLPRPGLSDADRAPPGERRRREGPLLAGHAVLVAV